MDRGDAILTHCRTAALRHDLGATMLRIALHRDNEEIPALLPVQLRELVKLYDPASAQYAELQKLITFKDANP